VLRSPPLGVNGYDIRSPPGIASTNRTAFFAWSDTRLAAGSDLQDAFSAVVQLDELPAQAGNRASLPYVIAVVAGLAVGGLVLLLAGQRIARNRNSGP
jgi:hypothetical protein